MAPLSKYRYDPGDASHLCLSNGWFTDDDARYCLFRGVNISSKGKRYPFLPFALPTMTLLPAEAEALDLPAEHLRAGLKALSDVGFNVIRLIVPWKAVASTLPTGKELEPNAKRYLANLQEVIRQFQALGMFVIVDFHQDIAHDLYGGDGFPDWAMGVDDDHELPDSIPRPDKHWQSRYYFNDLVKNTLRSFWDNKTTNLNFGANEIAVQQRMIDAMAATAEYLRGDPVTSRAILGYELFNEPANAPPPFGFGKRKFEEGKLAPFYNAALTALRQKDSKAFVLIEPRVDWNIFPSNVCELPFPLPSGWLDWLPLPFANADQIESFLPRVCDDDRLVFAFHYYDPWTILWSSIGQPDKMSNKQAEWPAIYRTMLAKAKQLDMAPFITEFGADHDWDRFGCDLDPNRNQTQEYLDLAYSQLEANLLSGTQWVCDLYYDPTTGDANWNQEKFSILDQHGNLQAGTDKVIARPYPQRSSAIPRNILFDSKKSQGIIILQGKPVDAPTVIFVPRVIHYPDKFEIHTASDDFDFCWNDDNQLLYWQPGLSDGPHFVIICKPGQCDTGMLPGDLASTELISAVYP